MPRYSQGARGLSVFLRVARIFTSTLTSLRPIRRQSRNRYAIHAGRQLSDKEFRYLRTLRVRAAVYLGGRPPEAATSGGTPWAPGRRHTPYVARLGLAVCCVFNKQSFLAILCGPGLVDT
jgi:hypothetical protein